MCWASLLMFIFPSRDKTKLKKEKDSYNQFILKVTKLRRMYFLFETHIADFASDAGHGGILKVSYYPGISTLILFNKNTYILHFKQVLDC